MTLQASPPILPHQEAAITDGSYRHLACRIKEHWDLKLEDGVTGPGQFLPACLSCMGRWSSYDESHELVLVEWWQRKTSSPAKASAGDLQTWALL